MPRSLWSAVAVTCGRLASGRVHTSQRAVWPRLPGDTVPLAGLGGRGVRRDAR
jgi:hypothetical protein